jgi:hypothetical protein
MDKVTRYGWGVKDEPGYFAMIDKNKIVIDRSYQRDLNKSKVLGIASDWSWIAFGVISIAIRDGVYYCINGQHRVAAAMKRSDIRQLPCIVFNTQSPKEEAAGFLNNSTLSKPISSYAKFKAAVIAEDKTALFVSNLLNKYQLKVSESDTPSSIRAIGRVLDLAKTDPVKFETVLGFCYELCHPNAQISKIIIDVIDYIHSHVENDGYGITEKALAKRILSIGPEALTASATRASAIMGRATIKIYAMGAMEAINKKLQHKYILDTRA